MDDATKAELEAIMVIIKKEAAMSKQVNMQQMEGMLGGQPVEVPGAPAGAAGGGKKPAPQVSPQGPPASMVEAGTPLPKGALSKIESSVGKM